MEGVWRGKRTIIIHTAIICGSEEYLTPLPLPLPYCHATGDEKTRCEADKCHLEKGWGTTQHILGGAWAGLRLKGPLCVCVLGGGGGSLGPKILWTNHDPKESCPFFKLNISLLKRCW